jgi:Holliday junction resolvase
MAAEANLTRRVRAWLDAKGCWSFKVAGGPMQRRGVPDILGCLAGRFFAIELKAPGGKVTPSQKVEIDRLREAGAAVCVARTVSEVETFFYEEIDPHVVR